MLEVKNTRKAERLAEVVRVLEVVEVATSAKAIRLQLGKVRSLLRLIEIDAQLEEQRR